MTIVFTQCKITAADNDEDVYSILNG